jgi:hypothetical protein
VRSGDAAARDPMSDSPDRPGIRRELRVRRHECESFTHGLRQQQPVERIAVNAWERIDIHRMLTRDWQFCVPVVERTAAEHTRFEPNVVPPERVLARDPEWSSY